ncbi:MAG: hypothetical protein ACYDA1_04865 [Vulcanimicrobiaceae bacterium]
MRSYYINAKKIGVCARVKATSEQHACDILNERIRRQDGIELPADHKDIEFLIMYPNEVNVRKSDIEEITRD